MVGKERQNGPATDYLKTNYRNLWKITPYSVKRAFEKYIDEQVNRSRTDMEGAIIQGCNVTAVRFHNWSTPKTGRG